MDGVEPQTLFNVCGIAAFMVMFVNSVMNLHDRARRNKLSDHSVTQPEHDKSISDIREAMEGTVRELRHLIESRFTALTDERRQNVRSIYELLRKHGEDLSAHRAELANIRHRCDQNHK